MQPENGMILAGVQSSSGKTAITCMLLAALVERGLKVQPFKAGPDFIDPGYHNRFAGGAASRNLDAWLMGRDAIEREVAAHTKGRIGILEGVMGLFDGSDSQSEAGSTMELARLLNWPVVLVLPSAKAGRSMSAMLRGFMAEAGPNRIAGVVLNQVSGASHAEYLREALASLQIPVLGAVPSRGELRWPERHLGLQASQERDLPTRPELARLAERYLDVSSFVQMINSPEAGESELQTLPTGRRIGIAQDEAFHFYYQANLDHLRAAGAELIPFSPLHDRALPTNLDGLLLGGGFPEMFTEQLTENKCLREAVREVIEGGLPCYAECGGLMYLAESLTTVEGRRFSMCGVIPGAVEMTSRLQHFGYCIASGLHDLPRDDFHGHEFHHSVWREEEEQGNLWNVRRKRAGSERREGYLLDNLHASYVHLHFATSGAVVDSLFSLRKTQEFSRL